MTAPCPCGGDTYVDDFAWPGRGMEFFLRCTCCGGMSHAVATEEEARGLAIQPEQAAEEKRCASA